MELGERLAKVRKQKGYKQKDIAQLLNVSQQVISNIERNTTTADVDFLIQIADLYEMSIDELLQREVVKNGNKGIAQRIVETINKMDETGKELSLSLIDQVAQHQRKDNEE